MKLGEYSEGEEEESAEGEVGYLWVTYTCVLDLERWIYRTAFKKST
jgi:hypothetical protein